MIWKHIKGFENLYLVSECGQVKSVPRIIVRSNGRQHTIVSKILKPAVDKSGYKRVGLMKGGKPMTKKVHRLVAETFHVFKEGQEVNHLDGDKLNNHKDNLEWCSRSDNMKHAFNKGLAKPLRGSDNPTAQIDDIKALTIKTLIHSGVKLIDISKQYGISYHIIKDINRGRTWKHV